MAAAGENGPGGSSNAVGSAANPEELNRSFEDEDDDVIVESEGGRRRIFTKGSMLSYDLGKAVNLFILFVTY